MTIKTGCCGFPVRRQKYYETFNCIEINVTFYQLPELKTAQKWHREAPSGFEFIMKAWQLITHPSNSMTYRRLREKIPASSKKNFGNFKNTREVFSAWQRTAEFAKTLGCRKILFQCPASFKPSSQNILNMRKFFHRINRDRKNFSFIWEPRGNLWTPEIISSLCRELGLVHCVDPTINKSVYGNYNYYRLHGSYERGRIVYYHEFSDRELKKVLSKCDKKLNYAMFNNVSMFDDAIRFKKMIN